MNVSLLNPYDVPKALRNYLYDHVILARETDRVSIVQSDFR